MKNDIDTIELLDCPIANLTLDETVHFIDNMIESKQYIHQTSVNAAKLVYMNKNSELKNNVISSDLINADGMAVIWASKFLNRSLQERVTGIDLMQNIVRLAFEKKYKIFFLGAEEEIVKQVVEHYKEKYSDKVIAGYCNGYFNGKDEMIAREISESGAHILFVAMSSPEKESFLNRYKKIIDIPFIMGVGGSFDVIAGKVNRAPYWMQRYGLEWFYRLIQEPRRMWKRYLYTNIMFIWLVLKEKFGQS